MWLSGRTRGDANFKIVRSFGSHLIGLRIINLIGFGVFLFGLGLLITRLLCEGVRVVFGDVLLELGVESVLDGVVGPSGECLGDLAPTVAVFGVHHKDQAIFLLRPLLLADVGVEVVVPSLPALLANATRQSCCDGTPVLGPVILHHLPQDVVLLLGPGTLGDKGLVLEFKPAIKALDFRPTWHTLAYLVPTLVAELLNQTNQFSVLNHRVISI